MLFLLAISYASTVESINDVADNKGQDIQMVN